MIAEGLRGQVSGAGCQSPDIGIEIGIGIEIECRITEIQGLKRACKE